jgi:hypothetical protein
MDLKKIDKYLNETSEKRWVHGSRDKKWHLVGKDDRDFSKGITQKDFKKLGKKKAEEKYYGRSSFIGARNESEDGTMAYAHPHGGRGRQGYNKGITCPHCGKKIDLEK